MPYCKKCGKYIEKGVICDDCLKKAKSAEMTGNSRSGVSGTSSTQNRTAENQGGKGSGSDSWNTPYGTADNYYSQNTGYNPQESGYGTGNDSYDRNSGYDSQAAKYGTGDSQRGQSTGYDAQDPRYGTGDNQNYGGGYGQQGERYSTDNNRYGQGSQNEYQQFGNSQFQTPNTAKTLRDKWVDFKNRVGLGEPETNDVDYYEHGLPIVPVCIDANEGEVPIKQYNAAILRTRLKFERSEGRLQVTNKRVIFRATGRSLAGRTTMQQEFAIDEIAGVKIKKNHRFSILNFIGTTLLWIFLSYIAMRLFASGSDDPGALGCILGVIVAAVAAIPFFTVYKHFWLKFMALSFGFGCMAYSWAIARGYGNDGAANFILFLAIIYAVILFINGWIIWLVPNLVISVETKGAGTAVEIRRSEGGAFSKHLDYTGFAEVMPWTDTEVMIIELWAMISDIQKYGDSAIEMWRVQ